MKNKRNTIKALKRYNRVKSYIKKSIYTTELDLNNYIQELIQANELKHKLIVQIAKP